MALKVSTLSLQQTNALLAASHGHLVGVYGNQFILAGSPQQIDYQRNTVKSLEALGLLKEVFSLSGRGEYAITDAGSMLVIELMLA